LGRSLRWGAPCSCLDVVGVGPLHGTFAAVGPPVAELTARDRLSFPPWMSANVSRGSVGPTAEQDEVLEVMRAEGWHPTTGRTRRYDVCPPHSHTYHKVVYRLRGTIRFVLTAENESLELRACDRLDLEPGMEHSAFVGPGVWSVWRRSDKSRSQQLASDFCVVVTVLRDRVCVAGRGAAGSCPVACAGTPDTCCRTWFTAKRWVCLPAEQRRTNPVLP
jgi:hypothetical protein